MTLCHPKFNCKSCLKYRKNENSDQTLATASLNMAKTKAHQFLHELIQSIKKISGAEDTEVDPVSVKELRVC